jgi:hypothetical protein
VISDRHRILAQEGHLPFSDTKRAKMTAEYAAAADDANSQQVAESS